MYLRPVYHMHSPAAATLDDASDPLASSSSATTITLPASMWDWHHPPQSHPWSPICLRFWMDGIEYRIDYLSLFVVLGLVVGVCFGLFKLVEIVQEGWQTTRASLQKQGVSLSRDGVSVKTDRVYNQEKYLDATQRKLINAVKASSFGTEDSKRSLSDIDKHSHSKKQRSPKLK